MASEAQVLANRRNAAKSTGPRTSEGKAIASQNSVVHGLSARHDVVGSESQAQFDRHRKRMLDEMAPGSPVEAVLAERIVSLSWRLRRAGRVQNEAIDALRAEQAPTPMQRWTQSILPERFRNHPLEPEDGELHLGRIAVKDFSGARVLDRLLIYERRIEHSLYRTIAEFQRLRLLRQFQAAEREAANGAAETSRS